MGCSGAPSVLVSVLGHRCFNFRLAVLQLTLVCGAEEKLVKVEEPSRCQYAGELATPALCNAEDRTRLQGHLDAAEAEVAAARDEL